MIVLSLQGKNVFVWNATDWLALREKHRIVGNPVGCLASLPRQDIVAGLPQQLLPEEVTLLIENNVAKLIAHKDLEKDENVAEKYNAYKETIHKEQVAVYDEVRKKQVSSMIDRIIAGKRRKLSAGKSNEDGQASEPELDREAILKAQLEKTSKTPVVNTLVQTPTADVWHKDSVESNVTWSYPSTETEKLKYAVFKDLWNKGYYITSGQKFGGDYLVYPGDPVKFHSQFIVVCRGMKSGIAALDLIALGRLGNTTRKTSVIATVDQNSTVIYNSISWSETR
ncbi:tRNA-splicing endonuclease subunit Sen34 [Nilaparvata lugens]|uniref:tRNA-splicing endonuclease subunit Sen34 n=1 Tax=Nilaparvata lugens TaxID=108931 RepID=UPI000B99BFC1|nr:tRNA-splicing endonuclease subunit Sen34 [Nilaparvata lugens]